MSELRLVICIIHTTSGLKLYAFVPLIIHLLVNTIQVNQQQQQKLHDIKMANDFMKSIQHLD